MCDEAKKACVGDPQSRTTTMGPVVNRPQYDRIQGFIRSALDEGARLVFGGLGRPDGLERGFFVRPTIFADVTPSMVIAREEIFGPVLAVIPYDSEDEAVEIANDTAYGLGGYLFTSSQEKAIKVGQAIRAGRIFLNGDPGDMSSPMGGYKKSGNGRELGVLGLEEYLEVKSMFGYQFLASNSEHLNLRESSNSLCPLR
jgi:aldehyde dehydrogenase (NAD+)